MPRVSVLLPTYNAGRYVREAMESLLTQSYDDMEILVIDDGSTDGTVAFVEDTGDERVRLIQREQRGLPGALNRGIREASGEYIARQDADDISQSERLSRQVEFLDTHADVAMVGTAAELLDADGTVTTRRRVIERPTWDDLMEHNQFIHGSTMMRRSSLLAVDGYDERFENAEDYDLWIRLARRFAVANIDAFLYQLRLRSESIYGRSVVEAKRWEWAAKLRAEAEDSTDVDRLIASGDLAELPSLLERNRRARFHYQVALELLRYQKPANARSHLRTALTPRTGPVVAPIILLAYLPAPFTTVTVWLYRRLQNWRIERRNSANPS